MVYQGCDEEYAQQVTSEHKVFVKARNGTRRLRWVKKHSHADNHYLDCEVYAMAAAEMRGVRRLHLEQYEPEKEDREESRYTPEEEWIGKQENWMGG